MGLGGDVTASGVVGDRGAARDRERGAQPVAQRPRGIHGGACEVHMSIAGPVVWASEGEAERVHRSRYDHHAGFDGSRSAIGDILCVESTPIMADKSRVKHMGLGATRRDGRDKFGNAACGSFFTRGE